jgi:hypothetical protein
LFGPIDYAAVARRYRRSSEFVPERYLKGAFSRRRTSLDVLGYVEEFFGWRARLSIMQHFGMPESFFEDPDKFVSYSFVSDVCQYLGDRGFNLDTFVEMGKFAFMVNRRSVIASTLQACRSPKELYDLQINHLMGNFDFNCNYKTTELTDDHCEFSIHERREVAAEIGVKRLGNPMACAARVGRAAALSGFAGFGMSHAYETMCVHRGDPYCSVRVEFNPGKLWKRSSGRLESVRDVRV